MTVNNKDIICKNCINGIYNGIECYCKIGKMVFKPLYFECRNFKGVK